VIKLVKVGSGMDDKSGHVTIKRSQTYLVKVGSGEECNWELRTRAHPLYDSSGPSGLIAC